eukprot:gnl/TRDRNA2_/TRDRNA2_143779_c0_seq1.p1 gnl/TRDRNA2_/TRDRNA2_143779_c0~~gnl/TRDRNA2_/TRDRNA2_143779_c0_seq1.p1  ORF type:complete len:229 (+),score=17.85 gnl/TRDRNA2_/TRDRNA2_143779_c0_seq1:38-688(+)
MGRRPLSSCSRRGLMLFVSLAMPSTTMQSVVPCAPLAGGRRSLLVHPCGSTYLKLHWRKAAPCRQAGDRVHRVEVLVLSSKDQAARQQAAQNEGNRTTDALAGSDCTQDGLTHAAVQNVKTFASFVRNNSKASLLVLNGAVAFFVLRSFLPKILASESAGDLVDMAQGLGLPSRELLTKYLSELEDLPLPIKLVGFFVVIVVDKLGTSGYFSCSVW